MESYTLATPEEKLSDKKAEAMRGEQSIDHGKNGLTVISGGGKKRLKSLKDHSENSEHKPELSEKEILQGLRQILDRIEVHHKKWTGGRVKKYSTLKTRVFAGRLPVDLLNEIHKFKGSNTYHLERALRLYVRVMGAGPK